jgi:hypothetical protein
MTHPYRVLFAIAGFVVCGFAGILQTCSVTGHEASSWSATTSSIFALDNPWGLSTSGLNASPPSWILPFPSSSGTAPNDDTGCYYDHDSHDSSSSVFYNDGNGNTYPMYDNAASDPTALIVRDHPTYIYRSDGSSHTTVITGMRGLGLEATFSAIPTGQGYAGASSGQSTDYTVFYHSQRCYLAGTEIGFLRKVGHVDGTDRDERVYFYYGININCDGGVCSVCKNGGCNESTGAGYSTVSPSCAGLDVSGCNSYSATYFTLPDHNDWLFEAWIDPSNSSQFIFVRRDPSYPWTVRDYQCVPIQSWFSSYATAMLSGSGLSGYITQTTNNNSPSASYASGVTMTVANTFAPTY